MRLRSKMTLRHPGRVVVILTTLAASLVAVAPGHVVASGDSDESAELSVAKTVTAVELSPHIDLDFGVDRADAIPGDPLRYTATLSHTGATLALRGEVSVTNTGETKATVAAFFDVVHTSPTPPCVPSGDDDDDDDSNSGDDDSDDDGDDDDGDDPDDDGCEDEDDCDDPGDDSNSGDDDSDDDGDDDDGDDSDDDGCEDEDDCDDPDDDSDGDDERCVIWAPLAGVAGAIPGFIPRIAPASSSGLQATFTPVDASGVTYPTSGDRLLGTAINEDRTARWRYEATMELSAAQLAALVDAVATRRIANTFAAEATPRSSDDDDDNDTAATARSEFTMLFDAQRAKAVPANAVIEINRPSGAVARFDRTTTPELATLDPGEQVGVVVTESVAVPGPRTATEDTASYRARLQGIEGSKLEATAKGFADGGLTTPTRTAATTLHVPILTLAKSGPTDADAGTTATYALDLANTGGALAVALVVTDGFPNGDETRLSGVPESLAASATAQASASYAIPIEQPSGPLTDIAEARWHDANNNPYGPVDATFTTNVRSAKANLSLAPTTAGPNPLGATQTLTATLTNAAGTPLANRRLALAIIGPNASETVLTTDAAGRASFTYTGTASGTDVAQVTYDGPPAVSSNTATISWIAPVVPITVASVVGNFFVTRPTATSFSARPGDRPAFAQSFPNIAFNPPKTIFDATSLSVDETTKPFTDVTTNLTGAATGTIPARGNGYLAGLGDLEAFDAVLEGAFVVGAPGEMTFYVTHDDGFVLGVGGGATRTQGVLVNPPASGTTAFKGYPVAGASNKTTALGPETHTVTVTFPAPGSYPFELDYFQATSGSMSLVIRVMAGGAEERPSPRAQAAMAYDPDRSRVVMFGGYSHGPTITRSVTPLGETWAFDTARWSRLSPPTSPSPRYDPAFAWDEARREGVLFGGTDEPEGFGSGTRDLNDTWVFDGMTWTARLPAHAPRFDHGYPQAVYDRARGEVVLVSSQQVGRTAMETWTWNGLDWTRKATSVAPSPRILPGLSYDPTRRVVVLFGGLRGDDLAALSDTWEWDGVNWREVDTPSDPPGREAAVFEFARDPNGARRGILFGGYPGDFEETFAYDGATWAQLSPPQAPPGRAFSAHAYHESAGVIALFGGTTGIAQAGAQRTELGDTWIFDGRNWSVHGPRPLPPTGVLRIAPVKAGERNIGTPIKGTVTAMDAEGHAIAGLALRVRGEAPHIALREIVFTDVVTGPDGTANFTYQPLSIEGVHRLQAEGAISGMFTISNASEVVYVAAPTPPPPPTTTTTTAPAATTTTTAPPATTTTTAAPTSTTTVAPTTTTAPPATTTTAPATTTTTPPTTTTAATTAPAITSISPLQGARITTPVPVSATITSATPITAWSVRATKIGAAYNAVLASGTGAPPATLATFDIAGLIDGYYVIEVKAANATGEATAAVSVIVGVGPLPPTIGTLSLPDGARISSPTPITVPIAAPVGETLTAWSVTARDLDGGATTTIASGTGAPPSPIATLDATMLENGTYEITVAATASGGGISEIDTTVIVDGMLKLGRFAMAMDDLAVDLGGVPITLKRTYDSTSARNKDFGTGWAAELASVRVVTNRALGKAGWVNYDTNCTIVRCDVAYTTSVPHAATVIWPDGRTEVFDFTPKGFPNDYLTAEAAFTPRPGTATTSRLVPEGPLDLIYLNDGNLYGQSDRPYDPGRFRLTTVDGTVFVLDKGAGLVSVTDRNGQSLTFSSAGVTSSSGLGLAYVRDASGRIAKVTGPAAQTLTYTYNASGRLATSTDPMGAVTSYTYDPHGRLTRVEGPGGVTLAAVTYHADGRVSSVADGRGSATSVTHDPGSFTQRVTDPTGQRTTLATYDSFGNLVRQDEIPISGGVATTRFTYDADNNRTSVTDPLGNVTRAAYDAAGNVTSTTNATGAVTTTSYNAFASPVRVVDATGAVSTFAYDPSGNLTSTTDPTAAVTTYAYDASGNLTQKTDATGARTTYTYNATRRLTSMTDPTGAVTRFAYDASGRVLTTTDPLGAVTAYTYDASGNLLTTTDPLGNTTTSTYDALGRAITQRDPLGNTTTLAYDAANNLVATTDPTGATTTHTYDAANRRTSTTDPTGARSTTTYDAFGRRSAGTDAVGATTHFAYDAAGRLTASTDPVGAITSYRYDAASLRTATTDPRGAVWTTTYDAAGRVTASTDPTLATTTYAYDPSGRLTSTADPLARVTTHTYDQAGRRITTKNPAGSVTTFGYDPAGRQVSITDPLGGVVTSAYDPTGRLVSVTDPIGARRTMSYDASGRLARETDAQGRITTHTYDQASRLATTTDPRGIVISNTYDAAGRVTRTTSPDGALTYVYDPTGRRISMSDPHGTTAFAYDAAGRVTATTSPEGALSYTYDPTGRRSSMTLPGARTATYTYDPSGNLATLSDWQGHTASFAYDPTGRRTRASFGSVTSTSTYDAASQRTALVHATPTATLASYTAAYDQAGNTTAKSGPAGPLAFAYDAARRLVSETTAAGTTTYAYDLAGNRTSRTGPGGSTAYAYSPTGELTSVAGQPVAHDGSGNVTSIGTDTFAYDAEGRLIRASVAGTTQTATYDADGVRISRDAAPHLVDREGGLATLVSDTSRAYLTTDGFAAQLDATSATSLLADPQGSIATLADASGTPTGTATYDAFGARATTGATSALGFTGEEHDPTGLVHLRARTYSPSLGRFLQPDPIQPSGPGTLGWNRYVYAADNPLRFSDPTGMFATASGTLVETEIAAGGQGTLQAGAGAGAQATGRLILSKLASILARHWLKLVGPCLIGATVGFSMSTGNPIDAVAGCIDPYLRLVKTLWRTLGSGQGLPFEEAWELNEEINSQSAFRQALGGQRGDGCAAHHIVPRTHWLAEEARGVLASHGISINDPRNGALIDGGAHMHLHTYPEIDRVNATVLRNEGSRTGILNVLANFKVDYETMYPCLGVG